MTIVSGEFRRGAEVVADGVVFTVHSPAADRLEVCLFDETGRETSRFDLDQGHDGVWQRHLAGIGDGQRYGYRAHGRYAPEEGLRFNPAKLLIDPYARRLDGAFRWDPAVFDYEPDKLINPGEGFVRSDVDSAPFIPKSVVTAAVPAALPAGPEIPWSEVIVYETNVRGYTMPCSSLPTSTSSIPGASEISGDTTP